MAKFDRSKVSKRPKYQDFEPGISKAEIVKITRRVSKEKGLNQLNLMLRSKNGETGFYLITFGTTVTDRVMNNLIASIEDNGVEIPEDLEIEFSRELESFLLNKEVDLFAQEEEYKGVKQIRIADIAPLDILSDDDDEEEADEDGFDGYPG